jgi:hypothetical protein
MLPQAIDLKLQIGNVREQQMIIGAGVKIRR